MGIGECSRNWDEGFISREAEREDECGAWPSVHQLDRETPETPLLRGAFALLFSCVSEPAIRTPNPSRCDLVAVVSPRRNGAIIAAIKS